MIGGLVLSSTGCGPDRPLLVVEVRSDARAGDEVDRVEVAVLRADDEQEVVIAMSPSTGATI